MGPICMTVALKWPLPCLLVRTHRAGSSFIMHAYKAGPIIAPCDVTGQFMWQVHLHGVVKYVADCVGSHYDTLPRQVGHFVSPRWLKEV